MLVHACSYKSGNCNAPEFRIFELEQNQNESLKILGPIAKKKGKHENMMHNDILCQNDIFVFISGRHFCSCT